MNRDPFEQIFESLDRTRHVSDAQIDELFSVEQLRAIAQDATPQLSARRMGKRSWRRGSVIAALTVTLIGSAAAAINLSRGPAQTAAYMTCYEGDSLSSTANVVSYNSNSLAYCSQLLHWPVASKDPHDKGSLCLLTDGSLAAFPPSRKFDGCKTLGLETFNGRLANSGAAKFEISAENYFTRNQCATLATARDAMLQLLGSDGLVGWKVRVTGSSAPSACATLALLTNSQEVDIVGIRQ